MQDFAATLAAAQDGDETAFVALFRSVQPSLLRYLRVLGGPAAEDAAAETWVGVVGGLPRFRGDEPAWRAWVFTIAHARLRDAQRRAVRSPLTIDAHDPELTDRADPGAWGDVGRVDGTQDALRLLDRLPRDQAAAVMLRHVVGLDVADTATVLGKRTNAVRVATHRGLRRLAELLAEEGSDPASGADSGGDDGGAGGADVAGPAVRGPFSGSV